MSCVPTPCAVGIAQVVTRVVHLAQRQVDLARDGQRDRHAVASTGRDIGHVLDAVEALALQPASLVEPAVGQGDVGLQDADEHRLERRGRTLLDLARRSTASGRGPRPRAPGACRTSTSRIRRNTWSSVEPSSVVSRSASPNAASASASWPVHQVDLSQHLQRVRLPPPLPQPAELGQRDRRVLAHALDVALVLGERGPEAADRRRRPTDRARQWLRRSRSCRCCSSEVKLTNMARIGRSITSIGCRPGPTAASRSRSDSSPCRGVRVRERLRLLLGLPGGRVDRVEGLGQQADVLGPLARASRASLVQVATSLCRPRIIQYQARPTTISSAAWASPLSARNLTAPRMSGCSISSRAIHGS